MADGVGDTTTMGYYSVPVRAAIASALDGAIPARFRWPAGLAPEGADRFAALARLAYQDGGRQRFLGFLLGSVRSRCTRWRSGLRHVREQGLVSRGSVRRMNSVDPVGWRSTPPVSTHKRWDKWRRRRWDAAIMLVYWVQWEALPLIVAA